MSKIDENIKNFLKGINIRNGVAFFQGIANETTVKVFEMGYRINGGNDYQQIERMNGTNYLKMMIHYSLTGSMGDTLERDNANFDKTLSTLLMYAHGGRIGEIDLRSAEVPEAIAVTSYHDVGDQIEEGSNGVGGTWQHRILRVKLVCDNLFHTCDIINKIQKGIVVNDENGKNLLFPLFDTNRLMN